MAEDNAGGYTCRSVGAVSVLFCADRVFEDHDSGAGHPERPGRIRAVNEGMLQHGLGDVLLHLPVGEATDEQLLAVHEPQHLARIKRFCELGGGYIDSDTHVGESSERLSRAGSGTLLAAVDQLRAGTASGAFVAVRPPGHHATPSRAMGFCLYNHVAVAAAALRDAGERVLVVDIDAHHGNGTQEIFEADAEVMYVSWHQSPHYPYTGHAEESGVGDGLGTTMNIPMPAGATGEHYRRAIEEVLAPAAADFDADWLLISAGFDAHRADPLCDLGLTSGDVADIVCDLLQLVDPGRAAALLEGGYDLRAVADCSAAVVAAMAGVPLHPEAPTSGGPGSTFVEAALEARRRVT